MAIDEKRKKFRTQRKNARGRRIEFKFTFEEWCSWWEHNLGKDWITKLGCRRDQYVMARKDDCGPYEISNVRCVTATFNHLERNRILWNARHVKMRRGDNDWYNGKSRLDR